MATVLEKYHRAASQRLESDRERLLHEGTMGSLGDTFSPGVIFVSLAGHSESEETAAVLVGCACPFDEYLTRRGTLLGGIETVRRGAFGDFLLRRSLVKAVINHRGDTLLGTTRDGGLELFETLRGLGFRLKLPTGHPETARVLRAERRGGLRGASVQWDVDAESGFRSECHGSLETIVVGAVSEVSLVIDRVPSYRNTWAAVDSAAARRRLGLLSTASSGCAA